MAKWAQHTVVFKRCSVRPAQHRPTRRDVQQCFPEAERAGLMTREEDRREVVRRALHARWDLWAFCVAAVAHRPPPLIAEDEEQLQRRDGGGDDGGAAHHPVPRRREEAAAVEPAAHHRAHRAEQPDQRVPARDDGNGEAKGG